jgi:hypothetical protein
MRILSSEECRAVIIDLWRRILRGEQSPYDEKKGVATGQEATPKPKPEPLDPRPNSPGRQVPSMTDEEITSLALSLYPQALDDPKGRKVIEDLHLLNLVSRDRDAVVEVSYYTGAWHALMIARDRHGNN